MSSLRVATSIVLLLTAVSLASCGGRRSGGTLGASEATDEAVGSIPTVTRSRMAIASAKPVDAYVMLGGRIKTCWFNPVDPLFPEHVYRADVSPDGNKVKITIHQKRNLGRAGRTTYVIDFNQEGAYTVVTTENRQMTPQQAAKMEFDIDRWKRGEMNCSKEMPKVAAQPQAE